MLLKTRFAQTLAIAALLLTLGSFPVPAQENAAGTEILIPGDKSSSTKDAQLLWKLKGGGEIVGKLVKETPDEIFIDIGPRIIGVPTSSVGERIDLTKAQEESGTSEAGTGSGVFDPQTGSLTFKSRNGEGKILSQQEVLEEVKKSVVLVSNPGGLGTGWVIDDTGRLVTNHHVVGNELFQTVTVFVKNGTQWEKKKIENCKVEAFSTLWDIAIVQVDLEKAKEQGIKLVPITIAKPRSLEAGDKVFAVGNPGMGGMVLDHTISEGIASSLARNFNDVIYLQTTAAVNPGNSGGPLVNERGEVVGLVTLRAMFQEGVAFALPVESIMAFLNNSKAYAVSEVARNQGFRYYPPN